MTEEKAPQPPAPVTSHSPDGTNPSRDPSPAASLDAGSLTAAAEEPAVEAPPLPEPLTPERMRAENRRNDLFIAAGVVILAFLHGWFKITDPNIWLHLKSGWLIEQRGVPSEDPFSYANAGKRWVNVHWLFDWGLYQAELAETRGRAGRLATDYENLLAERLKARFDDTGRDISKPLPDNDRSALDQAIAALRQAIGTSDTQQMRTAAEQLTATGKAIRLQAPTSSTGLSFEQASYPEIRRYAGPGGPAMIDLVVPLAVKAVLLAALAAVLLLVRHPGPTGWWTGLITALAIIGMGDRFSVSPEIVSLLLLALVFWILHEFQTGRAWARWLIAPILGCVMALWVNVDSLFPLGLAVPLIVLVCEGVSGLFRRAGDRPNASQPGVDLRILAAAVGVGALATLANPFGIHAWSVPWHWTNQVVTGNQTFLTLDPGLDSAIRSLARPTSLSALVALGLLALALTSVAVNWRGFNLARAMTLVLFFVLAVVAFRFIALASLTAGVVLALNGQEWFLRRFGTETRITRGWLIWSQGGRAVTVLCLVVAAFALRTGWLSSSGAIEFGYGIQWVRFDLDTGEFLREAKLAGRCLNTNPNQGNLLIWSNYSLSAPKPLVFLDGRLLLDQQGAEDFIAIRNSLRGLTLQTNASDKVRPEARQAEDAETLETLVDKYDISHLLLNVSPWANPTTRLTFQVYDKLKQSDHWELVQLDAANAMFGRIKLPEDHRLANDQRWFEAHGFDPTRWVFKQDDERLPDPLPPVTAPTVIDRWWRTRRIPTAGAILAGHLLDSRLASTYSLPGVPPNVFIAPPENCFLAIRAARRGLANEQFAPHGYDALSKAYFYLQNIEAFELQAAKTLNLEILELRRFQHLAALNQLVTAHPDDVLAHGQLAQMYLEQQALDMAHKHFEAAIPLIPNMDAQAEMASVSSQLSSRIEQTRSTLEQAAAQLPTPAARASFLASRGCPDLAIQELSQTVDLPLTGMDVLLLLAELYIRTGQPGDPDRGAESVMQRLDSEMKARNLSYPPGLRPGNWEEMWAIVKLMQGDYEHARGFLEHAIAEVRHSMGSEALLSMSQGLLRGGLVTVISTQSNLTEDADRQARLEFRLGLVQLEAGEPQEAKRHFEQALEVRANAAFRPVAGFYLEKITGQKLPALPQPPAEESETTEKKDESPKEKSKAESAEPAKTPDDKSPEK